ncbi:ClpP/crotonase-like domain-containing protein [Xylariomycetidae sp. FL2044]|nr:ClpP/crotonase-like domain-containing protein [Xylariomycetidae sp. FL2044]
MARLDPTYAALKKQAADTSLSKEQHEEIKSKMTTREKQLLPIYAQISIQFADLHDRAGRMKAKGTIREAIEWKNARRFFYWRVRRRLNEEYILKRMVAATTSCKPTDALAPAAIEARQHHLRLLAAWSGVPDFNHNDSAVVTWYEENAKTVSTKLEQLKAETVSREMATLLRGDKASALKGLRDMLHMMPVGEREEVMKYLK